MRIISIDPGVTTGYCYAELTNQPVKLKIAPFEMTDDVDDLWERLDRFKPGVIIIEDFEFRRGNYSGAGGGGLNLFPVQLIGVARFYEIRASRTRTTRLFIQKAAQGKSYYTDATLKSMGLYKRGNGHARDALRHLLQWATFGFGNQFIGNQKDFAEFVDLGYFT